MTCGTEICECSHSHTKTLEEIDAALGNGIDEEIWPPGKTRGECVKALVDHYYQNENLWKDAYIYLVEKVGEAFKHNCKRCLEETGTGPVYTELEAKFALLEAEAILRMDKLLEKAKEE